MKRSVRHTVEIVDDQKHLALDHRQLIALARKVLKEEKADCGTLAVWFTDDARIRKIHKKFMGKDTATDVISFEYPESVVAPEQAHLGDVIVSVERAVKVCRKFGETADRETARYLVHGILHLLGYDDHGVRKCRRMTARQEELLCGTAGPFAKRRAR